MVNTMVINMGMKSIRCMVFDQIGTLLTSNSLPLNSIINDINVEQIPDEWWSKACQVIATATEELKNIEIDYITVTSSASCLVCVDKSGNALMNALMISDKRSYKEVEEIRNTSSFKKVSEETNLEISTSLMLSKILWVKNNRRDIFDLTKYFLTPNDYLISKLSGEYVTDNLNATKYHYNTKNSSYPKELLEELEIPINKMPKVLNCGDTAGKVNACMNSFGMTNNTEIVLSSYDAICSFVGSGTAKEGEASDVSGTVTVFRSMVKNNSLDIKKSNNKNMYFLPFEFGKAQLIGGSNNLGGGLIEWLKQCYYVKEECPYETMEKEALSSEVGAKGLIFLPYLLGERMPIWDDNARGVFFGIERMHTRQEMTRAVFESTGFIALDMMKTLEEEGTKIDLVRVSGGLSRVNLISQIKADVLGKKVLVLDDFETTAIGAVMMVLLGQKIYSSLEEISDVFVKIRMVINPNWNNHEKYQHMYELYKETYYTLKDLFVKRIELIEATKDKKSTKLENL